MKINWWLVTVIVIAMGLGLATTVTQNQSAAAQNRQTLESFPQPLRGTWYKYEYQRYRKIKISPRRLNDDGFKVSLHETRLPLKQSAAERRTHPLWVIGYPATYRHTPWTKMTGWNSWGGHGGYFRRTHRRVKRKMYPALEIQSGEHLKTDGIAFQSKAVAKRFAQHHAH